MTSSSLRFCALGPFEVWHADRRVNLGGRRHERLLAQLVLAAPHTVSLDLLVDAVWDDDPPATAGHQVRKIVARLRQLLDPVGVLIVTDGAAYRIDIDPDQLDVNRFDALVAAAAASPCPNESITTLRTALAMWRGQALGAMPGQALGATALVLDDRRLVAVEQLAELCLTVGRATEVAADLVSVVREHPLRENLRYLLVLALYRCGRQADAYAAYEQGRRILDDELGVAPGPDLTRLHLGMLHNDPWLQSPVAPTEHSPAEADEVDEGDAEELRADDSAAAVRQPTAATLSGGGSALPYDTPDFTGRHVELAALVSILPAAAAQSMTIVTVDGMAGVGKTCLAIHAAHRLAERFPDGQLFLDLLGNTLNQRPIDPLEALERLLRTVGVPPTAIPVGLDDRSALWRSTIADKSMVLLLDNAASAAQVRPLLPGRPGSVVIVTSRARLNGLDGAIPVSLATPSYADNLAIVRNVLGGGRIDAEQVAVGELIEFCGQLPLAVRIAAARLQARPGWSVGDLLVRLRNAEHGLRELRLEDRSVEAAFRLTYDGLGFEHRRLFRLLALVPTVDFSVDMAAVVSGLPQRQVEFLLEDLLDARMLEQRTTGRYRFHDLLRSFGKATAHREDTPAERAKVLRLTYEALLRTTRLCAALVRPGREPAPPPSDDPVVAHVVNADQAHVWLDGELDNLVALVRGAPMLGLPEYAAAIGSELAPYLDRRCLWTSQVIVLEIATGAAREIGDRQAEASALVGQFSPLWRQGRTAEANASAQAAMRLARSIGDQALEAICLGNVGVLLRGFGQYRQSLEFHARAVAMHRAAGDRHHEAATLLSLGLVHGALGDHGASVVCARDALTVMRELDVPDGEVLPMINIGVAQAGLDELDAAETTLRSAAEIAARSGMREGIALAQLNLAKVLLRQDRSDAAMTMTERARSLGTQLDAPHIVADVETTRGQIHLVCGNWDDAEDAFDAALRKARQVNDRGQVRAALHGMIGVKQAAGDHDSEQLLRREAAELDELLHLPGPREDSLTLTGIPAVPILNGL